MNALIIGGSSGLWDDLRAIGPFHGTVIGINDALYTFEHLTAMATLHPEKAGQWRRKRRAKGWPDVPVYCLDRYYADHEGFRIWRPREDANLWGGGSSGLYAVGTALHAFAAGRVLLAGCPMDASANLYRDEVAWEKHRVHQRAWTKLAPALRGRVYSMSGHTADLLGRPEWLKAV